LIEKFSHVIDSIEIWVASINRFRTICRKSLLEQLLTESNQNESRFNESVSPASGSPRLVNWNGIGIRGSSTLYAR
jgi:hypothetical protein